MRNLIVAVTYNDYAMGTRQVNFGPFETIAETVEFTRRLRVLIDEEIAEILPEGTRLSSRNRPRIELTALCGTDEKDVREELAWFLPWLPLTKKGY